VKEIFSSITTGGDYCAGGIADFPCLPGLKIDGVGEISFPLTVSQAEKIRSVGRPVSCIKSSILNFEGTASNTMTTNYSTTPTAIQVEASKIHFVSQRWKSALDALVHNSCFSLGVDNSKVRVELYALLLDEQGSHIVPFDYAEEREGMFGTLVVQLPSEFSGGSLSVRHSGEERVFPMGTDDKSCTQHHHFLVYFSDCLHEACKITAGHRLVAVYKLFWDGAAQPVAPDPSTLVRLADGLCGCLNSRTFGYMLASEYSRPTLAASGIHALKNRDRDVAGTLLATSRILQTRCGPGSELVLNIVKAIRNIPYSCDSPFEEPFIPRGTEEEEVFAADGSLEQPGKCRHVDSFKFFRDVVNNYRKNERLWDDGKYERSGWRRIKDRVKHYEEYEIKTCKCYILTFYRRETAEAAAQDEARTPISSLNPLRRIQPTAGASIPRLKRRTRSPTQEPLECSTKEVTIIATQDATKGAHVMLMGACAAALTAAAALATVACQPVLNMPSEMWGAPAATAATVEKSDSELAARCAFQNAVTGSLKSQAQGTRKMKSAAKSADVWCEVCACWMPTGPKDRQVHVNSRNHTWLLRLAQSSAQAVSLATLAQDSGQPPTKAAAAPRKIL
jgi:hypothetical protein